MKKFLFLLVPFLLSSCMLIESNNQVQTNGDITYNAIMDMSGMVTAMESFSGLSSSSGSTSTPKNLCEQDTAEKYSNFYESISCQSLGDYKARMISTLSVKNNPGIYVASGVVVFNPLWAKKLRGDTTNDSNDTSLESMGIRIVGKFTFPYPIVYTESGKRIGTGSIEINMLDKMIVSKKDIYIVARLDGKRLTIKELSQYKRIIRTQVQKAKKSGKYENYEAMTGM